MRSRYNLEDKKFRNQADELRDYVRSKAERLMQLEFITQDQMEALIPFGQPERDEIKEWPVLENGSGSLSEAISHIQRYLYGKNIVYPLSLLQNFFALLSTGDLIILSGMSGSDQRHDPRFSASSRTSRVSDESLRSATDSPQAPGSRP